MATPNDYSSEDRVDPVISEPLRGVVVVEVVDTISSAVIMIIIINYI